MSDNAERSEAGTDTQTVIPVSASAWLRAPVALTVERWVLLTAALGAVILILVALD
ncbi:hypothetical protein N8I71_06560 [Roseibacterium sp. SDUM158016]|uniref:hypothetical protein n=1 Tax=Roseicyclus sediminis TaxID=2980997 RepID=UPI0021D3C575|nr:hypothetical protein [Roseibacterium sp. SDUM158016]MCU4652486.1 hypothetical protein [Roseibacterium sp. SDUM158016]